MTIKRINSIAYFLYKLIIIKFFHTKKQPDPQSLNLIKSNSLNLKSQASETYSLLSRDWASYQIRSLRKKQNNNFRDIVNIKLLQNFKQKVMDNPITLQQQRKVWTIHQSVNGITYYYNRSTKKSQYEMPECFKITEEDLDHPDWKQYRTAEGKKFYYNALTRKSCWHMPAEVKQWKMKLEDQKRLERQRNGDKEEEPLSEADQIKKKFNNLLKNKLIGVNTKWDVCIKLCEDDERWNLLKMSDKKKYFLEYITDLKKISQLQQKAKTEANRIQFLKMLKQHKNLTSDCKMHKIQFNFITDPRWRILDGVDKENAFQDYLDQLQIKQKQQSRIQKERNIQNLKMLLEQSEAKYDMKWQQFKNQFKDYQCYKKLHELDRINTFTKYIMQAEQRNLQKQKKQKRMKERTDRVQFRNMIRTKLFNGEISYKAKWRSFIKQFKHDLRLINMMDPEYKGSSPHEIFQNFMDSVKKNHKAFKSEIKSYFKKINFRMTQETTFNQFSEKLNEMPMYAQAKPILRQYFYHYFKLKIKSKNAAKQEREKQKERQKLMAIKKVEKREKKAIFKIFKQYNESTKSKYQLSAHIEKIEQNLNEQNINITRQNIFKYYLAYLAVADGQEDKKQKDSPSRSQKAKSKSRSSSSSKQERKKKKKKQDQRQKERESARKQKNSSNMPPIKTISIPNQLRQINDDNECQQEGQIKEDEVMESESKKQIEKPKQKQRERQKSTEKQKRKKKSAKKRKGSSSSSD